jgi:hypothetical protein
MGPYVILHTHTPPPMHKCTIIHDEDMAVNGVKCYPFNAYTLDNTVTSPGDGYDTIKGNDGLDFIFGGDKDDTLEGGAGFDLIFGDGGTTSIPNFSVPIWQVTAAPQSWGGKDLLYPYHQF